MTTLRRSKGQAGALFDARCRAGRRDRPYPETHGGWTIAIVRRGAFDYRAGATNQKHSLRSGWLLLGAPGADFECSHDHDGGDDCFALALGEGLIEDVASATPGCKGPIFPRPIVAPVTRVAGLLECLVAGAGDFDETAYAIAAEVLGHVHAASPSPVPLHATHRARIDAAIACIESSCRGPLALADLAAKVDLSPFHFLRVFRRVTGTTPHQYLVGARLRLAAQMLAHTDRPITAVAYDAGFEDLSNFIRSFRRAFGCSPRVFRKRA
ncbi:MAG TPA: AraC family transcriptional regulator [Polyangiaceae bacterium]